MSLHAYCLLSVEYSAATHLPKLLICPPPVIVVPLAFPGVDADVVVDFWGQKGEEHGSITHSVTLLLTHKLLSLGFLLLFSPFVVVQSIHVIPITHSVCEVTIESRIDQLYLFCCWLRFCYSFFSPFHTLYSH